MKISDFVPDYKEKFTRNVGGGLAELFYDIQKAEFTARTFRKPLAVELIVSDWLRAQYYSREQLVQDLYTIAYLITELRTVITIVRNEVFRRGFKPWIPKFVSKCDVCDLSWQEKVDKCPECGAPTRGPDDSQLENADKLLTRCNRAGQSFEEVLRILEDDMNIADDCFLLLNREYIIKDNMVVGSHLVELLRLHPALVTFDLTQDGQFLKNHFICLAHRDQVFEVGGKCPLCGMSLHPVMYVFKSREGQYQYLLADDCIHMSWFSP